MFEIFGLTLSIILTAVEWIHRIERTLKQGRWRIVVEIDTDFLGMLAVADDRLDCNLRVTPIGRSVTGNEDRRASASPSRGRLFSARGETA